MTKLLVPTDGSDASLKAVKYAAEIAGRTPGISIALVNVQPALPSAVTSFIDRGVLHDFHHEHGRAALVPAEQFLTQAAISFTTHVEVGQIGEVITDLAQRTGCDQIIMATRGLGPVPGLLIGSVAMRVLYHATVPVTFVK